MFSDKFNQFIEMCREDFGIERSIDEKTSVDKNGNPLPWYTYPAIEYLSQFDYADKSILEFGCGNSSIFWAARAKKVVSIEDNLKWFAKWQEEFDEPNLEVRWRDEGKGYEDAAFEDHELYDVVVVDGKRRAECAEAALKVLKSGGMIILDDSDRINTSVEYVKAVENLKKGNFIQVDFFGFCPMNCYTKTTSVFMSRDFDFKSKHPVQPTNGWGNLWSKGRLSRKDFYKKFG